MTHSLFNQNSHSLITVVEENKERKKERNKMFITKIIGLQLKGVWEL